MRARVKTPLLLRWRARVKTPVEAAFLSACELRWVGGVDAHGCGIPTGVAWGSVERYVTTGLRDTVRWPLTMMSLVVAQERAARREKAAAEMLWTESA